MTILPIPDIFYNYLLSLDPNRISLEDSAQIYIKVYYLFLFRFYYLKGGVMDALGAQSKLI